MTDTTWNTTIGATDTLSGSRSTINDNFAAARKLTVTAITVADSPYTAGDEDVIEVDASGGAVTINLPAISSSAGQVYRVSKRDASANAVTLDGDSSETINGTTTRALSSQYDSVTIVAMATEWGVL